MTSNVDMISKELWSLAEQRHKRWSTVLAILLRKAVTAINKMVHQIAY